MHRVAAVGGDGIGPEIIAEGKKVLDAAGERFSFDIEWHDFDIGADRYLETGELLTDQDLRDLGRFRAIYFGAIGDERITPGILEKGILLRIRFHFDQYINLRPVKLLDFVVVRENTEDFYVGLGSRLKGSQKTVLSVERDLYSAEFGLDIRSDAEELAYQIGIITREGSARVIAYAFELARNRRKRLTSVDKANVLSDVYGLWREVFSEKAREYPDVSTEFSFVDAITMWFVKNPEWFDVVVTPNMFGDIITDLGAMIQGGLGLAPGANINPKGTSMFEPIHGSAPKYKGLGVANPLATIWAGSMLLDHLGEHKAAVGVLSAIERSIAEGKVTKDMGGLLSTSAVGDAIAAIVLKAD
jgi:tartrate dehydrogenase/decarboxylase/D-malate dehydrogenase